MMPLHRDIHWLGRQWAVTGHGLQLINQKQMGYYDIEAARLWEARVTEVQSKAWIDRPDFDKALEIARGKFVHLAPADQPAPAAVALPPPPVRAMPPAAPRAPLDAESVPSIEELLARLKSKSVAAVPVVKPAEEAPAPSPKPEPPKLETPKSDAPKLEPRKVEPIRSELPKSALPKAPRPELLQAAPVTPEPRKPESRRGEPPKVEPPRAEAPKPEAAKVEPAKAEPAKTEPLKSEPHTSEMRQAAPVKKLEAPVLAPVVTVVRRPARPAWPVFDRKIAGSGRFVHPWRVTSAGWHGPRLPPRP
ncbi:hypothetical protein ACVW1C_000305 [Bradyrhizobium sp. USDA 4011]